MKTKLPPGRFLFYLWLLWLCVGLPLLPLAVGPGCHTLPPGAGTNAWYYVTNWINGQPVVVTNIVPPVVTPPATNPPPPVVTNAPLAAGLVRGIMFFPIALPKGPWITTPAAWPADSTQAYARSHGRDWENDYRHGIVQAVQNWHGNAIAFFGDKLKGAIELEMFLCDTASPLDQHHISDAENSAVWLKNVGCTNHIVILTDSPDWTIPYNAMGPFVQDLAAAYATARGIRPIWLIGLECNRNMTVAQVAAVANLVRQHAGAAAKVVCGSASMDFLKSVHAADGGIGLWKEQDTHPFQAFVHNLGCSLGLERLHHHPRLGAPLDAASGAAYINEVKELAALVGPANTYAGEWWSNTQMKEISKQITDLGINCNGQF